MPTYRRKRLAASVTAASLGLFLLAVGHSFSGELSHNIKVVPETIQWKSGPPSLPEGAQVALLEGDLTKAEPYTFRLKFPDGYHVPGHTHPVREHITVLQGELLMSTGDMLDREQAFSLPAGSLFVLAPGKKHAVWMKGGTIVQLHGVGPWGITYLDPNDDPRRQ